VSFVLQLLQLRSHRSAKCREVVVRIQIFKNSKIYGYHNSSSTSCEKIPVQSERMWCTAPVEVNAIERLCGNHLSIQHLT